MGQDERQTFAEGDIDPNQPWYREILPGLVGISVVVAARLAGLLQPLELGMLDAQLKWRPPEPTDDHITIIGINEKDIQEVAAYPIPDEELAELLQRLQTYDVQVIGLDIARDIPVDPGHADLAAAFQSMDNVIGAASVVPDSFETTIQPPPDLPPEQVGSIDSILDPDGHQRRAILGLQAVDGSYRFSMALLLAKAYLEQYGVTLTNGIQDPTTMRFGEVELPQVYSNSGGYVRTDAGGTQVMLNFRSGAQPFRVVSLMDALTGDVDPEWFRDRVVLIGMTSPSAKDMAQSSAVDGSATGSLFGVEVQAHAASQIINAALEERSLLRAWPDGWEYGWIVLWGLIGIGIGQLPQSLRRHFLMVFTAGAGLVGVGYVGVLTGWWLPVVPALAALLFNTVILYPFSLYDRSLRSRIRERQRVIEQTFTTIHNGPLQTLAALMRSVDDSTPAQRQLKHNLKQLNHELRSVYETIQQEVAEDNRLYLKGESSLDLTAALHELLYEVYSDVLRRDFHNFAALKITITKFEPFDETALLPEQKRELCRFLEEMLCNVGKHATGISRLTVECRCDDAFNVIRVIDNGAGVGTSGTVVVSSKLRSKRGHSGRRGTQQALNLARQLNAVFERSPQTPKGTRCELKWKPKRSLYQQVYNRVAAALSRFKVKR